MLLLAACALRLLTLGYSPFGDEADNLALGRLMTEGLLPYRDIFCHHFPFPYFWSAAAITVLGPSVPLVRLSVLVFTMGCFVVAMGLRSLSSVVALAGASWLAIAPFYAGHMVLYQSFVAAVMVVLLVVVLAASLSDTEPKRWHAVALGFSIGIAILCDPLSVYPVGLALLALLAFPRWRAVALSASMVSGLCILAFLAYLLASGTLGDFWREAVLFNSRVYTRYRPASPLPIGGMLQMLVSGLGVASPEWFSAIWAAPFTQFVPAPQPFDNWVFSGFFLRLSVLVACLILLLRRRYVAAGFVYLFVATLLATGHDRNFQASPFVAVALVCAAWVVLEGSPRKAYSRQATAGAGRKPTPIRTPAKAGSRSKQVSGLSPLLPLRPGPAIIRAVSYLGRAIVGVMLSVLTFQCVWHTLSNTGRFSYRRSFAPTERRAREYARLVGGVPNVRLGLYPEDAYVFFLTGFRPLSRFLFVWPWVYEVARSEIMTALERETAIVTVKTEGTVWGTPFASYLSEIRRYCEAHFVHARDDTYLSPRLAALRPPPGPPFPLQPIPPDLPAGELTGDKEFAEVFRCSEPGLCRVELLLATYDRENSEVVSIHLFDHATGKLVAETTVPASEIEDNAWLPLCFEPIGGSHGRTYRIALRSPRSMPGNAITVYRSRQDAWPEGQGLVNDRTIDADLVMRYRVCSPGNAPSATAPRTGGGVGPEGVMR